MMDFVLSVLLGLIISIASVRLKILSYSGAFATFLLAVIVFYFGKIQWTLPLLIFFILSSFLSKVRKKFNPQVNEAFQKSEQRDHAQVLSNGGAAGLILLANQIFQTELFYIAYVSAIASVCADTWATEIGTLFSVKTYNILNFEIVEQGISGGVSLIGFIGAMLGSTVIFCSALPWLNNIMFSMPLIIFTGFAASVFDSMLGATLQLKLRCTVCSKITERKIHCNSKSVYSSGISWLDNDWVNFLTSLFGAFISLLAASIFL